MTIDLRGQVAVITGSGTGIGREIALELARHGARVVCAGRRRDRLDETVAMAAGEGTQCRACVADVANGASVAAMAADIIACEGRIDLLVNNAASFGAVGALWEVGSEEWWRDVTINLKGTMLCTKAVLPDMLERGSGTIINLDGGGGADGVNKGGSAYGSSKAGVARLTETLARELAAAGYAIEVYGIFPGLVRSAMTEGLIAMPASLRWQQFVADRFDEHNDRPATDCAKAVIALLSIAGADLSGRVFTVADDFPAIARRRAEIAAEDLRVMRLRPIG